MSGLNILNIATYNCKGFKIRNYEYIRKLFNSVDVLLIQEHWLFSFEFNIFSKVLNHCHFVSKSSMKDDAILTGRPYGGVAIAWKSSLNYNYESIITSSDRLIGLRFFDDNLTLDLIILNVYMPCRNNENNVEFTEILYELSSICMLYASSDVVVGGDFNCSLNKDEYRGSLLNTFLENAGLSYPVISDHILIDYTFINSMNSKSIIDYIFISESFNYKVNFYKTFHDGDNLSDHSPVKIGLNKYINHFPSSIQYCDSSFTAVDWSKANVCHIQRYKSYLQELLEDLNLPDSFMMCMTDACSIDHE